MPKFRLLAGLEIINIDFNFSAGMIVIISAAPPRPSLFVGVALAQFTARRPQK